MALDEYRSKRDFSDTREPRPEVKSSAAGNLFVIHKHAARTLHYDLRLEMDGVLKSWAVPKGPSLDPDKKRLAVQVEDHPLDYADFEGAIPDGRYGAGTVMVWDRGRWFPESDGGAPEGEGGGRIAEGAADPAASCRAGKLRFRLEGEKLHGGWVLVRLRNRPGDRDGKNWLLIKERDGEAGGGAEGDITVRAPNSVKSGWTMEQIADERGGALGDARGTGDEDERRD